MVFEDSGFSFRGFREDSVSVSRGFRIQYEDSGFSVTEKRIQTYVIFSERTKITFVLYGFRATNNAYLNTVVTFLRLSSASQQSELSRSSQQSELTDSSQQSELTDSAK